MYFRSVSMTTDCMELFTSADELRLKTFDYTDHSLHNIEHDIDPDNHFYLNMNQQCSYFTEEQLRNNVNPDQKFTVIHFNSSSLSRNFP